MLRVSPARARNAPELLLVSQSKEVNNKRKREEEKRLDRLAVTEINRQYREAMYPPDPRVQVRDPSQLTEGEEEHFREQQAEIRVAITRDAELRAAAPEPPPRSLPVVMTYCPQGPASFEERVSAIEWTLLAKIRNMTPSGADADRIEVLEKFLLRPENQGQGLVSDRLIKLEAVAETIGGHRRFGPRTFY
jgi:hypothetical protein